jgi:hypothetical protein
LCEEIWAAAAVVVFKREKELFIEATYYLLRELVRSLPDFWCLLVEAPTLA